MIVKLIEEGNPPRSAVKDVGFCQSAVCKIWCKYKRNKVVK